MGFCGFSLLAAGNLAGYAAVYLKNDGCTRLRRQIYAKFCRGELLLIPRFFAVAAPNLC